ncbi:glucose-responsive transcription factor [Aspergillus tubingensis]|uniref:C6 finger domain protein n=2 Tax=Aspergillus subgen. Circumdati TaxID=2720871 RepID=A0A117E087_ASPNG|nr:C6 finger domain protein [Aspergillus tubingensis]GAQ42157.1 C6 finger domain protein [Aspergillus niger]GFN16778.1 C6 finger domain protein [Aspergillus tubingensis]GLA62341.1 glucose-responsive transcription factor [Aspergillus tubingensis]GLA72771.1 glucose-responsive transcription factor [Aspergillus tubingensis]GLA81560.1 glucose-responsive transcription factor [Aspergillus tubingensis]
MNSRDHADMPPAPSYPSPNAAQMSQGAMQYYNRQLTADELLSAELSRETSGPGLADGSSNGVHHGQSMVLGSSNPGGADMGRPSSPDQHQQQHMLQFTPSQQVGVDPNHDLSYGDQSARRKRSKISRACDECRRKKVRCDASSESGVETCSNCRRLGVVCQFSRVPMKRGPSKGYIKELAERLHTLESQMQPTMVHPDMPYQTMNEVSSPRAYQDFSPPIDAGPIGRKRTYSVFEGLPSSSFAQAPFNPRSQNAFEAGESATDPCNPSVVNHTAPKSGNLFWSTGNETDLPAGLDIPEVPKQALDEDMTPLDVDEGALNAYYQKIHPVLPILPHSKERLLELLHQCSREVQEIFLYSLLTVTRTNMDRMTNAFERVTSFDNAQDLLLYYTRQPAMLRPAAINLIWLQTLLLMIVDCDSRGPDNFVMKDGVPKHTLIQSATKLGSDMAKAFGQLRTKRSSDPDVDSDANLVRRSWVSLALLSRWYAISVADYSVLGTFEIGGREDERVLGSATAGIASYSTILIDMVTLVAQEHNVCQTNTGLGRLVGANMVAGLERLAEVADFRKPHENPDDGTSYGFFQSLQNQLYWTSRLLIKRHIFVHSPYEIIYAAEEVMNELHKASMQSRLATPFDLHSLALASMTLLEATVLPEYSNQCWEALKKLEEILDYRSKRSAESGEYGDIFGTPGWDSKIRVFLEWRRTKAQETQLHDPSLGKSGSAAPPVMGPNEQRSLQHLADLAVGAEGQVAANASSPPPAISEHNLNATSPNMASAAQPHGHVVVDFTLLTKEGYLNVFSGLIYRRR